LYNGLADLVFNTVVDGVVIENKTPVYVEEKSVTRQEFLVSYQTGTNSTYLFEVRSEDYELTLHINADTKKPSYATGLLIGEALYDIIRHYGSGNGKVQLTCS
jgi:hypothetical protein